MKSFLTRLLSGIVLIALIILTALPGGAVTAVAYGLLSCVGLYELFKAKGIQKTGMFFICLVVTVLYYVNIALKMTYVAYDWIVAVLVLLFMLYVIRYPKYEISDIALSFMFFIYLPVFLSFVVFTRRLNDGVFLVWLIYFTTWGCDTLAYCTGMLIGKHKLTPELSPKKSIEGAVGGVIGAALLAAGYGFVLNQFFGKPFSYVYYFAAIAAAGAVISQIGDLTASGIKRTYDIKDYGKLIPGHGGVMDRFDSVIIIAPIIYYLSLFLFV